MPPITCHILDTATGKPAAKVTCALYFLNGNPDYLTNEAEAAEIADDLDSLLPFAIAETNADGRVPKWAINKKYEGLSEIGIDTTSYEWKDLKPGVYKIRIHTKHYFLSKRGQQGAAILSRTFFPFVDIHFVVDNPPDNHYHIPLLLSNHGYSTYRGS